MMMMMNINGHDIGRRSISRPSLTEKHTRHRLPDMLVHCRSKVKLTHKETTDNEIERVTIRICV